MDESQGLLSALQALADGAGSYTTPTCAVGRFLEKAKDKKETYASIIDNKAIPATQIAMTFKKHELYLSVGSIRHHRNRLDGNGCKCPADKK